jgi:hypothetical protein
MEKSGGWLKLNAPLLDSVTKFKLQWWKAYENEKVFKTYQALMLIDIDTLKSIQTIEEAEIIKQSLINESYALLNSDLVKETRPFTEDEKAEMIQALQAMLAAFSDEERKEYWQGVAFYWLGFIITFFDILSLMVHGKSLRQLVTAAKQGDDEAYYLAVQVDRTVLFLPCFQDRLLQAQMSGDSQFLESLAYRIKNPIIRGKIRRRTLWLLFALLESESQLDMPLRELLELCIQVGAYGKEFGVGDENSLAKRKREYQANHRTRKIF